MPSVLLAFLRPRRRPQVEESGSEAHYSLFLPIKTWNHTRSRNMILNRQPKASLKVLPHFIVIPAATIANEGDIEDEGHWGPDPHSFLSEGADSCNPLPDYCGVGRVDVDLRNSPVAVVDPHFKAGIGFPSATNMSSCAAGGAGG